MSSLAAARADNFYYPPDFDANKHKSLAKVSAWQPTALFTSYEIQHIFQQSNMCSLAVTAVPWLSSSARARSEVADRGHPGHQVRRLARPASYPDDADHSFCVVVQDGV